MTVKIDLLREAIAFSRANPELYNQGFYFGDGVGCVIGRSAILAGATVMDNGRYIESYPGGNTHASEYATNYLGLSDDDFDYIASGIRTLDQIERRVNEIAAREAPVIEKELVKLRVNGTIVFNVPSDSVDWFIAGARAVNSSVRITKEVEL